MSAIMVNDSSSPEFGVSYQGPAVADNVMDVRDLAPALLALGGVFDRANLILNGERTSVSLSVRPTQPGSFDLALLFSQIVEGASDFLTSALVTSAVNLQGLLVGAGSVTTVGGSLIWLFKKLKGRKPSVKDRGEHEVIFEREGIRLSVPTELFRLYEDRQIQTQTQALVEPLYRQGIDRIAIHEGDTEIDAIEKEHAAFFGTPSKNDETVNEILIPRQVLRLVSPVFQAKEKWRLNDGSQTNWYSIRDKQFMREVTQGIRRFGMGDILICRVRTVQRLSIEGLDTEYEVLQVTEHQVAPRQLRLHQEEETNSE